MREGQREGNRQEQRQKEGNLKRFFGGEVDRQWSYIRRASIEVRLLVLVRVQDGSTCFEPFIVD